MAPQLSPDGLWDLAQAQAPARSAVDSARLADSSGVGPLVDPEAQREYETISDLGRLTRPGPLVYRSNFSLGDEWADAQLHVANAEIERVRHQLRGSEVPAGLLDRIVIARDRADYLFEVVSARLFGQQDTEPGTLTAGL